MLGLAIPVMSSIAKPVAAAVERIDVAGRLCLMLININFNFQGLKLQSFSVTVTVAEV